MILITNKKLEKKLKNPYDEYHNKTGNQGILYPKYPDNEVWDLQDNIKDQTKWEYNEKMSELAFLVKDLGFNGRYLHFIDEGVPDTRPDRKKHLKDPNYQKQCYEIANQGKKGKHNEKI